MSRTADLAGERDDRALVELLDELGLRRRPTQRLRWLVVAAHPADETVGASWILSRASDLHVLHVTDGAPHDEGLPPTGAAATREEYGALRQREVQAALGLAGIACERLHRLGLVEEEAGAALANVALAIEERLQTIEPAVVVVQAFEGGHPDHDACAFAVHAALQRLRRRQRPLPALVEMTSYHRRGEAVCSGAFLPAAPKPATRLLRGADRQLKQRMLACFRSQAATLAPVSADAEPFRVPPPYDFEAPPHVGVLDYEALGRPMTAELWCQRASRALRQLGLSSRSPRRMPEPMPPAHAAVARVPGPGPR